MNSSPPVKPTYRPARDEVIDAIVSLIDEIDLTEAPSSRKVTETIRKENPTWRIPERRVAKHLKRQLKARNSAHAANDNGDVQDEESVYSETSTSSRSVKNFTFFSSPLKYLSSRRNHLNVSETPPQLDVKSELVEDAPVDQNVSNLLPIIVTEDLEEKVESLETNPIEIVDHVHAVEESLESKFDSVVTETTSQVTEAVSENIGEIKDLVDETPIVASEPKESENVYKDDNDGSKNNCYKCTIQ